MQITKVQQPLPTDLFGDASQGSDDPPKLRSDDNWLTFTARTFVPESCSCRLDAVHGQAMMTAAPNAAPHRARSIRTISEFPRTLSNTICLPSAVTSKDCVAAELFKRLSWRDFFVARSSSQKSCAGNGPCAYTSARPLGTNR